MNKVSSFEMRIKYYWHRIKSSHLFLKYIYPRSATVQLLLNKKASYGTAHLLTLMQQLLRACGRKRKLRKPDYPLISDPFPAAFLSPLSLPYKILPAQEAVCWGLPRDVHALAQQPAADNWRFCSLSEQHHLESLLHLMTNSLQSDGNTIYFQGVSYHIWLKQASW